MDWAPTELQDVIRELSREILTKEATDWSALVASELTGLDELPEICTLLIEVGRSGARVPVLETLLLGAPIRAAESVPPDEILSAGLLETGSRDPRRPTTRLESGRLHGEKICVPAADRATRFVLSTTRGVVMVRREDCQIVLQEGTNGDPLGILRFDGSPATLLGGSELLDWWLPRVEVGVCALLLGLAQQALEMTARYAVERHQFGQPIGAFQAVRQRAADAWIDTQVMEVTLWQAAWRVCQGLSADREIAIARYWASEGCHRVLAAAQHLHGGTGFDRDYPLHRYFLTCKQWELLLGPASARLEVLGDLLAASSRPDRDRS